MTGSTAARLEVATGITPGGAPDGNPITFAVVDGATTTPVAGAVGGDAGAITELLTTSLPGYLGGLDTVARELADSVNARPQAGYDLAGVAGTPPFSYAAAAAASTLEVAVTDRLQLAASGVPGGNLDSPNADQLGTATPAEASYQRLVSSFGSAVVSTQRLASTQRLLTTQVDTSREQLSRVDPDEETVNMLTAQRGYQAAARVMRVMDSVLDTLIKRPGLLR